ncbi:hypothetical protein PNOK_0952900 [Pyrrhoderma noxium]|uniref:ASX DEUBAD domain-containing protein n=1 Tax=Pyrrhoderma noxium TaxID=2282107 RepID=A0A286U5X0_9AGAM|nr:hypothetical protein PNOK_0952900 [Pyrrhoderma noxium]
MDTDSNSDLNPPQEILADAEATESNNGKDVLNTLQSSTRPRRSTRQAQRPPVEVSRQDNSTQRKTMKTGHQEKPGSEGKMKERANGGTNGHKDDPSTTVIQTDSNMDIDDTMITNPAGEEKSTTTRAKRASTLRSSVKRKSREELGPELGPELELELESGTSTTKSKAGAKAKTRTKAQQEKPKKDKNVPKTYNIDFVLTSSRSPLVNMDISNIINYQTWTSLSVESQHKLAKLLPVTAFHSYNKDQTMTRSLDKYHPSRRSTEGEQNKLNGAQSGDKSATGEGTSRLSPEDDASGSENPGRAPDLDSMFFLDPHFQSAARTFQDHLFSGWMTQTHHDLVADFRTKVDLGSLHAPWKDEVWDDGHPDESNTDERGEGDDPDQANCQSLKPGPTKGKGGKGRAKVNEFTPLIQKGYLKEGDVICLRYKPPSLNQVIEKDALITSIHPRTSEVTLTSVSGPSQCLPQSLLIPRTHLPPDINLHDLLPPFDSSLLRDIFASSPSNLVTALLDLDGRIPRTSAERSDISAWHVLELWRWPSSSSSSLGVGEEGMGVELDGMGVCIEEMLFQERGGRERLGTLHYLVNS